MPRKASVLLIISLVLSSCAPGSKVSQATGLPKGNPTPGSSTPQVEVTTIPTGTPAALQPLSPIAPLVPRAWPAPFTYDSPPVPSTPIPGPVPPIPLPPDTINILLLGSDRRTGTSFRTDTILLLSIQPSAGGAALISIPRDLYVYLPGYSMQRVNTAFNLGNEVGYPGGGRALLADTLLYNLGVTFDYYARVEMSGFQQVIDELDGVDVRVSCPYTDWRLKSPGLDLNNPNNWHLFTVPTGVVHMNGDFALWYARSRERSSDFDRSRRQQEVLRAAYRQALQLGVFSRIPSLYQTMIQSVTTDMSLTDILRLAPLATKIDPAHLKSRFIGRDQVTSWRTPSGAQVLLPKPVEVQKLLVEALDLSQNVAPPTNPGRTIQVINASGHSGWAELAAERLTYAGFEASVDPSPAATQLQSQLTDFGFGSTQVRSEMLSSLGLASSDAGLQAKPDSPFAYQLIVGQNYNPCFDPTRNQPGLN